MAVYVDDMYRYPMGRFGRMKMSHMVADTEAELYEMADRIGVARRWVQQAEKGKGYIHFDVSMSARRKAIENGAVELTLRQLSSMCAGWRRERAANGEGM
ncbi:MAG: DUF4031 domain-containing protein [Roseibium sp.]|nr:DUF4031 domain-containing protein [Roseibium sp.]